MARRKAECPRITAVARAGTWLLLLAAAPACEKYEAPNIAPTVRIVEGSMNGEWSSYHATFVWEGDDVDGTVDHYLYAIETVQELRARRARGDREPLVWRTIRATTGTFQVPATTPTEDDGYSYLHDKTAFHIRAVDDDGDRSAVDTATFEALNLFPRVGLMEPVEIDAPSNVCESAVVRWRGSDWQDDPSPIGYQMKLIEVPAAAFVDQRTYSEARVVSWFSDPDSLRLNLLVPDGAGGSTDWHPPMDALHTFEQLAIPIRKRGHFMLAVRAVDVGLAVTPPERFRTFRAGDPWIPKTIAGIDMTALDEPDALTLSVDAGGFGARVMRDGDEWRINVPASTPVTVSWLASLDVCGVNRIEYDLAVDIPDPDCSVCVGDWLGLGGWRGWGARREVGRELVWWRPGEYHALWIRARKGHGEPIRVVLRITVVEAP